MQAVTNRIIEILPDGMKESLVSIEEYPEAGEGGIELNDKG